ncbi:TRAP-type C4-dicarboxylate transport system permease small subunit [Breoghania corrubedonensis]|uniref:TRAP transporter small permease protein n=1 Tax=Breoghania corrubedonensis TaxID=665038 RepID=A0A2T5VF75_9HYPH|nr:TRAP transporter small permease [Breoghania corrubedonensis]PTW62398.1 TRAP-type C4-dicarboxylate transport system permease small subunit [Breoghania corrubedonensis]
MTQPEKPNGDAATYRVLSGTLAHIEDVFNLIAAASIMALMLLAVVQIFARTFLNQPVPGFIDITEQAMAVFTFLGIAYCQRVGGHIRMEMLLGMLSGRAIWIAEFMGVLVILAVVLALDYGSWFHFYRAWTIGDSTIDINLPTWPSKLLVPVALSLLVLRLVLQLVGYWRLIVDPTRMPIDVPVVVDVTETARHEIEETLGDEADEETGKGDAAR